MEIECMVMRGGSQSPQQTNGLKVGLINVTPVVQLLTAGHRLLLRRSCLWL